VERIKSRWPGNRRAGANAYNDPPGYHWFHLQAQPVSGTMSGGGLPGFQVSQYYSRQYVRSGNNMNLNTNPDDYGKQNGGLSAAEMRIFGMFSDDVRARSLRQDHPMEALYGITRP
jgi:hypothetical protein